MCSLTWGIPENQAQSSTPSTPPPHTHTPPLLLPFCLHASRPAGSCFNKCRRSVNLCHVRGATGRDTNEFCRDRCHDYSRGSDRGVGSEGLGGGSPHILAAEPTNDSNKTVPKFNCWRCVGNKLKLAKKRREGNFAACGTQVDWPKIFILQMWNALNVDRYMNSQCCFVDGNLME